MKERPILFSSPMVRAILEGSKTQTRRIVKGFPEYQKGTIAPQEIRGDPKRHPAPYFDCYCNLRKSDGNPRGMSDRWCWWDEYDRMGNGWVKCPYGAPGDQLWVREKHIIVGGIDGVDPRVIYSVDSPNPEPWDGCFTVWRPSIHMPRWASRITLEVVSVRVERLQDISGEDAFAEGVPCASWAEWEWDSDGYPTPTVKRYQRALEEYEELWESINGPGSWAANPWVWVVEFRRVK